MQIFAQLGRYLRNKRNFLIFSVSVVGLPCAVFLVWRFGHYGDTWFKLFVFVIAVGGGLLWGVIMWEYFKWLFPSLREERKSDDRSSSKV
jgi:hypothetical protein